jgi:hypothetical protein
LTGREDRGRLAGDRIDESTLGLSEGMSVGDKRRRADDCVCEGSCTATLVGTVVDVVTTGGWRGSRIGVFIVRVVGKGVSKGVVGTWLGSGGGGTGREGEYALGFQLNGTKVAGN